MTNAEFLLKYDAARGNRELQAALQAELGYQTWGGVKDKATQARRAILAEQQRPSRQRVKQYKHRWLKESSNPSTLTYNKHKFSLIDFGDFHIPFGDRRALNLVSEAIVRISPDVINIHGDWWDFYPLSRFDKDPSRINQLKDEIDSGYDALAQFRREFPDKPIFFEMGNHEDRLRKYLWRNARELNEVINPDEMMGFIDLEIDRVPKHQLLEINGVFKLEHGDVVSKHSGWTAKAMFERRGGCGMVGHSHRLGSYYKHDSDYFGWWENGCVCSLYPEYVKNPNWMHGFSVISFVGDRFFVEQVPIIDYEFVYGGEVFRG